MSTHLARVLPLKCIGPTPSVQDLSRAVTMITTKITNIRRNRKASRGMIVLESDIDYLARFTIMLKCSYMCARVGVAFLNVMPISVSGIARRVRCASYVLEWLGSIIEIHHSFGFKMRLLAMGEFACHEEDVRHVHGLELEGGLRHEDERGQD
jgi:hypothetical protein